MQPASEMGVAVGSLELHRIRDTGGTLVPDEDVGPSQNQAWMLAKPEGKGSFSVDVEFTEGDLKGFSVGIVPLSTSLWQLPTNVSPPGVHCNVAVYNIDFGSKSLRAFEAVCKFNIDADGGVRRIRVKFIAGETPQLLYSINDCAAVDVTKHLPKPLQPGEYKPFIGIGDPRARFRCHTTWRKPKRALEGAAFVSRTSRLLWQRRLYTDVTICVANGERIRCHRAQLAEGSPVLAAELDRWADEKQEVEVNGEHLAVESMIAFFYTGELDDTADAATVLPLAHRYQVDELTLLAVDRLLERLSTETVLAAARALRPLRDHGSTSPGASSAPAPLATSRWSRP